MIKIPNDIFFVCLSLNSFFLLLKKSIKIFLRFYKLRIFFTQDAILYNMTALEKYFILNVNIYIFSYDIKQCEYDERPFVECVLPDKY